MAESRTSGRRFVEPRATPQRLVAVTVRRMAVTMLAAVGIGFVFVLGLTITLEEGFEDLWRLADLDPISRGLIAVWAVIAGAAAIVYAAAVSIDRLLLARQLVRTIDTAPEEVPTRSARLEGLGRDPITPVLIVSRVLVGVLVTAGLIDAALWNETDDSTASLLVLGVCVVGTGGLLVLNRALTGPIRSRWRASTDGARSTLRSTVGATTAAERRRRSPDGEAAARRGSGVGAAVGRAARLVFGGGVALAVVGVVIHFSSVFTRQPGRFADERSLDDAGEALIDALSRTGAVVVAAGLAVMLVGWILSLTRRGIERRALLRAALAGTASPRMDEIRRVLDSRSVLGGVGDALVGAAVVLGGPLLATRAVAGSAGHPLHGVLPTVDAMIGAAIGCVVLGALCIGVAERTERDARQTIRDAWHVGDDPAPKRVPATGGDSAAVWSGTSGDGHRGTDDGGHGGDGGDGGSSGGDGGSSGGGGDGGGGGGGDGGGGGGGD